MRATSILTTAISSKWTLSVAVVAPAFMLAAASISTNAQQPGTASLPGGASSLREAYEDWVVNCVMQQSEDQQNPVKVCSLGQEQVDQRSRQRLLAVELRPSKTPKEPSKITFILPFGLDLQKGVTLQLDDGRSGAVQRVRTCIPAGCLFEVNLDPALLASLGKAKQLKVNATADGGKDTPFTISLKGFPNAYARTVDLVK